MKEFDPKRFYNATQALKKLHKYYPQKYAERRGVISEKQIERVIELINKGYKQAEIARMLQIAPSTVYNVERRRMRAIQT